MGERKSKPELEVQRLHEHKPTVESKWREPLAKTQPTVVSDGVTESWRGTVRLLAGCPVVRTQEGFV